MTIELTYLALAAFLTGCIWIPYILNLISIRGLINAVGYPKDPAPISDWASRMKAAHANAIENLAVFAALVLVIESAGLNNGATAMACVVYFWARIVHLVAYTLAIPWVRTVAFAVGFGCQATLALQILA